MLANYSNSKGMKSDQTHSSHKSSLLMECLTSPISYHSELSLYLDRQQNIQLEFKIYSKLKQLELISSIRRLRCYKLGLVGCNQIIKIQIGQQFARCVPIILLKLYFRFVNQMSLHLSFQDCKICFLLSSRMCSCKIWLQKSKSHLMKSSSLH